MAGRDIRQLQILDRGDMASSKVTKIFTYARTATSKTDYANKINRLSKEIFGEVRRPMNESQMTLVKKFSAQPLEQSEEWITYYPGLEETNELMRNLRDYGLYRNEHLDFKEEMVRLRALRGKAKIRAGWKDGKKPEKIVVPRYDGLNSYKRDPGHY